MMKRGPDPQPVDRDTPLRLDVAVELGFPAGGITVAGLRTEIDRGTLDFEIIAGKFFTTLNAIDQMRERCRVRANQNRVACRSGNNRSDREPAT
jgi:hypothetical protein